jgi:hypothetical protein
MPNININLTIQADTKTTQALGRIEAALSEVLNMERRMAINVQNLIDAVAQETTVDQSILALVAGIAQQNKDLAKQLADAIAANDPTAIAAVQKAIDDSAATILANSKALQDAVAANTPPPPAA